MSLPQRGQEVTLRISVDGLVQTGSFFKVKEFTGTPRQDIREEDFLGETESDLDFQHHGFDLAFSVRNQDEKTIEFLDDIIEREQNQEAPPNITITAIHAYRERGARNKVVVYHEVFLKVAEEGFPDRKESVMTRFEGKCKKRSTLNA
jgi:hypothetical protein